MDFVDENNGLATGRTQTDFSLVDYFFKITDFGGSRVELLKMSFGGGGDYFG